MTGSAELPTGSIDRRSPIPLYFQLSKALEEEIEAGRLAAGDRLPSEPVICARFGLSRTTVRQALAQLEGDGRIRREKGRGTFIADRRSSSWHIQSAQGFYDEAVRHGHAVRSRVLRQTVEPLPPWASHMLGLAEGSSGVTLERLRFVDELPVMYVLNHLPPELASTVLAADLESGSLYGTLERQQGLSVVGGRRVVEAVTAEAELADLLRVAPGAALLFVESVSWADGGRPFECYRAWHRADRTKLEVQVVHEEIATRAGMSTSTLRLE